MGPLAAMARIVELGGAPGRAARVAEMRRAFEARTGAFTPDDAWFEERSRAFWCDAVTRERFGREVERELTDGERAWLVPLERAHRGLFRARAGTLIDAWSGAEIAVTEADESSRAELDAAADQLFDARVAASDRGARIVVALLPGAAFHPREATVAIEAVLAAARDRAMATHDTLDALLRMERTLRSMSRMKPAHAYRAEALSPDAPVLPVQSRRRAAKAPT